MQPASAASSAGDASAAGILKRALSALSAEGIAAAALDCRGKGTSTAPPDPSTGIDGCAGDVVAAALGLGGPVVLLGHGLDALIARRGAERLRQLAGLLLIAPCPL